MGEGDEWPPICEAIVGSEILVIATSTWLARPSSVAQRGAGGDDAGHDWSRATGATAGRG